MVVEVVVVVVVVVRGEEADRGYTISRRDRAGRVLLAPADTC